MSGGPDSMNPRALGFSETKSLGRAEHPQQLLRVGTPWLSMICDKNLSGKRLEVEGWGPVKQS